MKGDNSEAEVTQEVIATRIRQACSLRIRSANESPIDALKISLAWLKCGLKLDAWIVVYLSNAHEGCYITINGHLALYPLSFLLAFPCGVFRHGSADFQDTPFRKVIGLPQARETDRQLRRTRTMAKRPSLNSISLPSFSDNPSRIAPALLHRRRFPLPCFPPLAARRYYEC